jgi:hypothetical protein
MGSFIIINTDDLDSLKVALNTRVHGMCETAPIDAGERLMNVINKFTSGGMDTSDEKATSPIDSVMPRFSVSLVYKNVKSIMLRTLILSAKDEANAMLETIEYFKKETDGMGLVLKAITELNEA